MDSASDKWVSENSAAKKQRGGRRWVMFLGRKRAVLCLFSDVFNVLVRREVLIRDDTKVMDVGESEHSGAVNPQLLCTV